MFASLLIVQTEISPMMFMSDFNSSTIQKTFVRSESVFFKQIYYFNQISFKLNRETPQSQQRSKPFQNGRRFKVFYTPLFTNIRFADKNNCSSPISNHPPYTSAMVILKSIVTFYEVDHINSVTIRWSTQPYLYTIDSLVYNLNIILLYVNYILFKPIFITLGFSKQIKKILHVESQ